MIPKRRHLRPSHIFPLVALMAIGATLLPVQVLAQSCYGGYCGSGDGADGDAKIQVTVTVSVSPANAGTVLGNETEPTGGVFTVWQGDTLVLEAIPNAGYAFDRWSGWFDESDTRVEAPIYNHKTLTARFVEVSKRPANVEMDDTASEWLPAGTVAVDQRGNTLVDISVELRQPRALPSSGVLVGDVYDFKPDGATFDPPIPISLPYDVRSLPDGIDEEALVIAIFDPTLQDWVPLPSEVNRDDAVVTSQVSHFSEFAIVAPMPPGNAPLITPGFSFSSLTTTPGNPYKGQDVTVTVVASYMGANAQARTRMFVTLDGEVADETEIVLSPGDHVSVKFTVQPPQEGTYTVEVNGLAETITVAGTSPTPALTQAMALADQDRFGPLDMSAPSLLSQWKLVAYAVGALVGLLLLVSLLREFKRRILRYRYDL